MRRSSSSRRPEDLNPSRTSANHVALLIGDHRLSSPPRACRPGEDEPASGWRNSNRSEEHTSELQSPYDLVCRLLLEKKNSEEDLVKVALERMKEDILALPPAVDVRGVKEVHPEFLRAADRRDRLRVVCLFL